MRDCLACSPPAAAAPLSFWRLTIGPSALLATTVEGMAARYLSYVCRDAVELRLLYVVGKYFFGDAQKLAETFPAPLVRWDLVGQGCVIVIGEH